MIPRKINITRHVTRTLAGHAAASRGENRSAVYGVGVGAERETECTLAIPRACHDGERTERHGDGRGKKMRERSGRPPSTGRALRPSD